jgi:hypothetical protein
MRTAPGRVRSTSVTSERRSTPRQRTGEPIRLCVLIYMRMGRLSLGREIDCARAGLAKKIRPAGANAKGSHWCLQSGTANDEHYGLAGGIGAAASSLLAPAGRPVGLTPLIGTLNHFTFSPTTTIT